MVMMVASSFYEHETIVKLVSGSLLLIVLGAMGVGNMMHMRELDRFLNGGEDEVEC